MQAKSATSSPKPPERSSQDGAAKQPLAGPPAQDDDLGKDKQGLADLAMHSNAFETLEKDFQQVLQPTMFAFRCLFLLLFVPFLRQAVVL